MKTIREEAKEMGKVMDHFATGGAVEVFSNKGWVDDEVPSWNWADEEWRIKQKTETVKYGPKRHRP